jgi:hypothetical protein
MMLVVGGALSGCAHYTSAAGVSTDKVMITKSTWFWPLGFDTLYICNVVGSNLNNCHESEGP